MKTKTILAVLTLLVLNLKVVFSQTEINLITDKAYLESDLRLFNIKSIDNTKICVKYLSFHDVCVKSDNESTMKGNVLATRGVSINGYIPNSNVLLVLTEQEFNIETKSTLAIKNHLIALRDVDQNATYKLLFEGTESKLPSLLPGTVVPFNKLNVNTIPNISNEELEYIKTLFTEFTAEKGKDSFLKSALNSSDRFQGAVSFLNDVKSMQETFKLPTENENTLKYDILDDGVEYLITRDRRIKKDIGVAYKSYFVYNKRDLVKVDSVFFADKSSLEWPQRVYDIDKKKYNGMLMFLSCEPLVSEKKGDQKYFRCSYFDREKNISRYRFQLESGKLGAFWPQRTFKLGDTLIQLTTKKTGMLKSIYESSVFTKDTVNLRYPLSSKDTLKYEVLYCGKSAGYGGLSGTIRQIFLTAKAGKRHFIFEQEAVSKSSAGLVQMGQPGADDMGYSITNIYSINNNAVERISKISVPYFSNHTSNYSLVHSSVDNAIFLIQFNNPIFVSVKESGEIKLKEAKLGEFIPVASSLNKYTYEINNIAYVVYKDHAKGIIKLIKLDI